MSTIGLPKGRLITFEGIDGAGKSTQLALLRRALEGRGFQVVETREPGGDGVGEAIRQILLSQECVPRAELLLFLASRAQNTATLIRPALAQGAVVLCDRYTDSSVAYQGYGRGLDPAIIEQMNHFATENLTPHLTILLDIPPEEGLRRQQAKNRMEAAGQAFLERVRHGYLDLAQRHPQRIRVVDALSSPEAVHHAVCAFVFELLGG